MAALLGLQGARDRFRERCWNVIMMNGAGLISLLRAEGKRITLQRRLIIEIIQEHGGHLNADEIYRLARERHPRVSLSTVYRTLDLLKGFDLIKVLQLKGDQRHYEVRTEEHQHLVCLGCGRVIEFHCAHCEEVDRGLALRHGFEITTSRVELLGYCAECAKDRRD